MNSHRWKVVSSQFKQLPFDILEKFVNTYIGDFMLFGYEARPNDIFIDKQVNKLKIAKTDEKVAETRTRNVTEKVLTIS